MKHCKIILLVGLLASSASALAEKIGVSMAYFDQNFLTIIRQSIEKEAQARHVDVQFEDARGDTGRQADQVQSFIASGVDAIIVDPVDSASTPKLTKMAQQARMPLVYVNRTPGDKTLPPGVVFVGSDERESGTLQMEALAKLANYKGNVAIMIGNLTDAGALQRTKDVEQVVAKYPAMKVVQKQPANYSRSEGMDLMQNWAGNGEEIDIVAANNDEMAIGAAMALEKSQKKLLIGGIDATPDGLKALASDKIQVTVFQDAVGQGKTALAVALKLIKGEKVESHVWIPFELVTKENMQTYVEKSH
ncbi:sugar ABC transporter substrate-binding protein [Klebsiella quasipneumoniae]|uniref:sugar ABC transporter substrate-binding protein n=1 Tax=Klebsiella quasipneumoniae TaxID=1463165 RepID=UPI00081C1034|nr:sugar ABC transporter substrate-binding protein [Klebsiella quasipneumoniae]MDL5479620.1 sugar ABC transporter substrate-binding protein [Klebsiella quasipneumoniae]OCV49845.1 rhizopine-binding protein [Klebsiella quasipneumoniae subsp. similipneumoniae]PLJ31356.1 rhizopine-binding protein [Klebsiella quasipneumoniae]GKP60359.1 rhizopine-binding protein [Klebsiella quasipneumoniae]HED3351372.1 sugar ABC transporter substrate-binding protein [Klebsiella quasipneumoniae subsp. similipneumonia